VGVGRVHRNHKLMEFLGCFYINSQKRETLIK